MSTMKVSRVGMRFAVVLCGMLSLAACANGSTGGPAGATPTATATATTAAKATAKPAPTAVPAITAQYCQGILTVAQANQIMQPSTPATTLNVVGGSEVSACNYGSAPSQSPVLSILFEEKVYTGPKPIPQATITGFISQVTNKPGIQVTTAAPVSSVGDQAEFLALTGTFGSVTLHADAFYVLDGNVIFMCDDFHIGGAAPADSTQKAVLQQCAQRVVAQL